MYVKFSNNKKPCAQSVEKSLQLLTRTQKLSVIQPLMDIYNTHIFLYSIFQELQAL